MDHWRKVLSEITEAYHENPAVSSAGAWDRICLIVDDHRASFMDAEILNVLRDAPWDDLEIAFDYLKPTGAIDCMTFRGLLRAVVRHALARGAMREIAGD